MAQSNSDHSAQGSIIPTMFIGIGGTGSRIVDRLAARAELLPNWDTQLRPLTNFVSIDTNELDQHKLKNIPDGNRLNIAAFDKSKVIDYYRRSEEQQALQWLHHAYQPRPGYKPGAGQIRIEARVGFYYHSQEIRQRLEQLVRDTLAPGVTWRQSKPPKYNVYFYTTLAGGTGSGSFLLAAYLIDKVINDQNWQPRVVANLLLSTLMLDKVGPELHPDIHANTYAGLKELEHLTKLGYPQVKREGRKSEPFVYCRNQNRDKITTVKSRPFFVSFIFDRPPHVDISDAEAAIADAGFLQVFTPIIDNLTGELDNYEKNLEELTQFPGHLRNVGLGYTKNYGAFGAAAMVLPGKDLLAYCSRLFAAQAIRSQITFGVDRTDPDDDRARALTRHAVDYSDPKFLSMGDEGRERAINRSFVTSVQEMARQDEHQDLAEGFWKQLVDRVDLGRASGVDDKGEVIRGESLLDRIERTMAEDRQELLNKVSVKARAFVFHKEGLNQYVELVSRLRDDIRAGRRIVDEGVRGLETSAAEGEVVTDLKLDPITERYLVLRLAERCESKLIPQAEQVLEKTKARDIANPKVREHLEKDLNEKLREAAAERRFFKKDQTFLDTRDEAQEYYRNVASSAIKTMDAEVRLRQLRELQQYLQRRARQYARLATRMDGLVEELERDAERLRRGESAKALPLALRVEVFETLEEPRQRLWNQVYKALFIDGGRYISTFDRQVLAATISGELKPIVKADGQIAEKTVDQTVADMRRAMLDLAAERLRPAIFGGEGNAGLDLARGLELEARIVLQPGKQPGEDVSDDEIAEYQIRKFRVLSQIAGVLARVSSAESQALDDGVKVNRTRQLIVGASLDSGSRGAERFLESLKSVLEADGRQVKQDTWRDPRLAVVHDVELPIPLYYFQPVTEDVEAAYIRLAADERKSYNLHTDYNWEKSLPNLNPYRSEITVGWALQMLAEGMVAKVISFDSGKGNWLWHVDGKDRTHNLGPTLSSALYRLGEIHRDKDLPKRLEVRVEENMRETEPDVIAARRDKLVDSVSQQLDTMALRQMDAELSREDVLDRPVLRILQDVLMKKSPDAKQREESGGRYDGFSID